MIPLFQTRHPERAANLLIKHYASLLIQCHGEFSDRLRIRFRADRLKGAMVYFDRTSSQLMRWKERGGVLVTWSRNDERHRLFGPHEAIVLSECPTRMALLKKATKDTTCIGVIYNRPNWGAYETAIRTRREYPEFGEKMQHRIRQLTEMRAFVEALPTFSRRGLRDVQQEALPPLSFPESREAGALVPGMPC